MHALAQVVDVVINVLIVLIIVRVLLSWFPGAQWSPWGRTLARIVDPVLRPFQRVFPTFAGIDVTPIVAIVVLRAVDRGISIYLNGAFVDPAAVIVYIVEQVLLAVVLIMAVVVFLRLVISLLQADPWHPAVRLIRDMSRPLVQPFATVLPRSRGFDTAALLALVAYVVVYFVIQALLDGLVQRL